MVRAGLDFVLGGRGPRRVTLLLSSQVPAALPPPALASCAARGGQSRSTCGRLNVEALVEHAVHVKEVGLLYVALMVDKPGVVGVKGGGCG